VKPALFLGENCPHDGPLLVQLLSELASVQVRLFSEGQSLLQEVHREAPALILVDLALPRLDGFLLTRLLKFDSRFCGIPILGLSTLVDEELVARFQGVGGDAVVAKPVVAADLLDLVKRLLCAEPDRDPGGPAIP
jgi:CheY-like chemotaxis protein